MRDDSLAMRKWAFVVMRKVSRAVIVLPLVRLWLKRVPIWYAQWVLYSAWKTDGRLITVCRRSALRGLPAQRSEHSGVSTARLVSASLC